MYKKYNMLHKINIIQRGLDVYYNKYVELKIIPNNTTNALKVSLIKQF